VFLLSNLKYLQLIHISQNKQESLFYYSWQLK